MRPFAFNLTELTHPNIHVHRFTGGLHEKALLVDDTFAAVGTANFDTAHSVSLEITLAVSDARFAGEVHEMFQSDFAESVVGRGDYESRPFYFKAGAQAARLLAPPSDEPFAVQWGNFSDGCATFPGEEGKLPRLPKAMNSKACIRSGVVSARQRRSRLCSVRQPA